MQQIRVVLTPEMLEALDELVARGVYLNRSEAIRIAIRGLLRREKVEIGK